MGARVRGLGVASSWLVSIVALVGGSAVAADTTPVYQDAHAPLEQRVEDLLARLTDREKISLMAGGSAFATQAIARLGIPALSFSDGPNGVRSNAGTPTTVFPTGSALAATWSPELLRSVGEAIGREARALDIRVMLGPNVNIQRSPLAGRNFEAYSEDPYLAGRLGIGFVQGVQSQGVGTSVKHFVANEQEADRMRSNSVVDERTLREIYLLPFEMIVKEAHPWTVMASYNRLNGAYMSENNALIRGVLKGEWGYDGLLMSDWGAVHTTVEAANAGLDLEMPGPPHYFGAALVQATRNWQVEQPVIDDAARRVLRLVIRTGALDGNNTKGELRSDRNRATALQVAREAITLLKNDGGLLPLDKSRIHTLAVIGPNADVPLYEGGGSAAVIPSRMDTPLTALHNSLGAAVKINYVAGADNDPLPPPFDPRLLSSDLQRKQSGLKYSYYNNATFSGSPVQSGTEVFFDKIALPAAAAQMSMRWEGFLWPDQDGTYELSLSQLGQATLYLDDRKIIAADLGTLHAAQIDFGAPTRVASVMLQAGRSYRIRVDYVTLPTQFHSLRIGLRRPPSSLDAAVSAARSADAAIVFVGSSRATETEGRDRPDMELAGAQNELVAAVLAANSNTIVVVNSGAPVVLPWVQRAPALLEAWLAGEAEPAALVQILFGDVNPSGKLPVTFPRRLQDNPAYLYYSPGRDAYYGEGVFVGYRYYDKREVEPLFPFGHGLSYTTFEYGKLHVPPQATAGHPVEVSVEVKNTGRRAGQETVQLYVGDETTQDVVRPVRELRAFQKISLAPGESRTVSFTLSARDFSYYDVHQHTWAVSPGKYRIDLGSSSRDIRQSQSLEWVVPRDPRAPAREARPAFDPF
jgi:beta-glucosidase